MNYVKIGNLRISPDAIVGYMPLYNEGRRAGITLILKQGKTSDFLRITMEENQVEEALKMLDEIKL